MKRRCGRRRRRRWCSYSRRWWGVEPLSRSRPFPIDCPLRTLNLLGEQVSWAGLPKDVGQVNPRLTSSSIALTVRALHPARVVRRPSLIRPPGSASKLPPNSFYRSEPATAWLQSRLWLRRLRQQWRPEPLFASASSSIFGTSNSASRRTRKLIGRCWALVHNRGC
jgi:hypothetical protein